ncbi:MAG: hypothetical protein MI757_08135 [Pirellulales bacterium]|nr:hypothetical protein [Pirellulales bacterium]
MKQIVAMSAIAWFLSVCPVGAQDAPPTIPLAKPEVVLTGLSYPTSVVIQPITGNIFVGDTDAGRVIRLTDGKQQAVITGFPRESDGRIPTFVFSPLTLAFVSQDTLVVGGGGTMEGTDVVRFYRVPAAGTSISAADAMRKLGPIQPQPGKTGSGGGNVIGVAVASGAVYVASNGSDSQDGVARVTIAEGKPTGKLARFTSTGKSIGLPIASGITLTHNGHLLVAQRGKTTKAKDSVISFFRGRDGRELLSLATGLHDITGLAYSPATGRLYATDFAWNTPKSGGLYRLDREFIDDRQVCKPTLITQLYKPTALAFGKSGELYVTVIGSPGADGKPNGKLMRFEKGL